MSEPDAGRELVNPDYAIDAPGDPRRHSVVHGVRAALAHDGCAVIRDFLSPAGLQALLGEALDRAPRAYYSPIRRCNLYFGAGAPALGDDHPCNLFLERSNGFVTADLFDEHTAARQLYHWPAVTRFVADCLGKPRLHLYADPVSNMIVNVSRPGEQFNWHFDTNEFTITLLLQAATAGGHFEYVADLRTAHDERYDDVGRVLCGDRSRVRRLALAAGDLQLFLGRFSLHRVTRNVGASDRLLLIMSFTEKPGVVGSLHRVQELYGKVTAVHRTHAAHRVRADDLLD